MARAYQPRITLPIMRSEADSQWIESVLMSLQGEHVNIARSAYSDVYREEYESEPVEYRKEGKARYAANTRLREYQRECIGIYTEQLRQAQQESQFEW